MLIWLERFLKTIKVELPCSLQFSRVFKENLRMDETDHESTDCKVLSTDDNVALDTSEVVDYLENATTLYE